jgi:hypothetical protein
MSRSAMLLCPSFERFPVKSLATGLCLSIGIERTESRGYQDQLTPITDQIAFPAAGGKLWISAIFAN